MRQALFLASLLLASACAPSLPELPADIAYETATDYEPVSGEAPDGDVLCTPPLFWYDGACRTSDLLIATTGGYDVPFSGAVWIAPEENTFRLAEVAFSERLGGPDGTDLSLSAAYDRFMVIGRDGADTVWAYDPAHGQTTMLRPPEDRYLNFMDAAWDGSRYTVSANEATVLFSFDENGTFSGTIDLMSQVPEGIPPSPAALLFHNGTLTVALQMLGPDWASRGGRLGRWDDEGSWHEPIPLPLADPVGPLAMNHRLSSRHLFVACAGSYQARNGGLVRVDLFSAEATTILNETTEPFSPLDVKVGPLAVTNEGNIYFTAFDADWKGHLQVLRRDGTVERIVSGINAFAAIPLDYSPRTNRLYFFTQRTVENAIASYLTVLDTTSETIVDARKIAGAPAALRVWIRDPLPMHERR